MEVKQINLKELIENQNYLDKKTFRNVANHYFKNNASCNTLDLILKYLKNYPHQISLISKSNLLILTIHDFLFYI